MTLTLAPAPTASGIAAAAERRLWKSTACQGPALARRVAAIGYARYRTEDRTDVHGMDYRQLASVIVTDTGTRTELYGIESDRPFFDRPERPRHGDRTPANHAGPVLFD